MRSESLPRPLPAVEIRSHPGDAIALQESGKLSDNTIGRERRSDFANAIQHRDAARLAMANSERHAVSAATAGIDKGGIGYAVTSGQLPDAVRDKVVDGLARDEGDKCRI